MKIKRLIASALSVFMILSFMITGIGTAFAEIETLSNGYEIDMEDIPKVHFENHPEWEELYEAAWSFHKGNIRKATTALNPEDVYYVDEAFDNSIFQWDTLFMMMFDKYGINQFPTLSSMDNFYYHQFDTNGNDDGYICRRIGEANANLYYTNYLTVDAINPPLFAWAEWEQYLVHGNVSRFTKDIKGKPIVDRLTSYFQFIKRTRTHTSGPLEGLYISNGQGNGLDNTPNQAWNGWGQAANDMSIQQVQAADYIAIIAKEIAEKDTSLNQTEKEKYTNLAQMYEKERDDLTALIQEKLWSEEKSFFFNALATTGELTNIATPTGLWSLAAGVATEEQAEKMIETYVLNSEKMFRPNGLSTVTYDYSTFKPTGGYWNGAMWSPTSYQMIKGLQKYGYNKLAFEEAVRHINALSDVYQDGATDRNGEFLHTLWENYSSEYIKPGSTENSDSEPSRTNFVGWTGALAIGSMIEDILGVTLDAPDNVINWTINLAEGHGISNLYMNNQDTGVNRVSLSAGSRVSQTSAVDITVICDKAFTLNVKHNGETHTIEIASGTHSYNLGGTDGENPPYLSAVARYLSDYELASETFENAKDYVYFTGVPNELIDDGLKNQMQKSDCIYNVNTVGYRASSSANPVIISDNAVLNQLGFSGAKDYSKASHVHGKEGFMLMAPATTSFQTLKVIVGVQNATATISAALSDASAKSTYQTIGGGENEEIYAAEIPYASASDGNSILVKYVINEDAYGKKGKISLKGIILEDGGAPLTECLEKVTLQPGNTCITVDASATQEYDSYKIYVGKSIYELENILTVTELPYVIGGLTNYNRYYISVSGIKDGVEGPRTPVESEVPEDSIKTDRERAYIDWENTINDILNGNTDFGNITNNLNFNVTGKTYGSAFSFTTSSDGQNSGIKNDGSVDRPIYPQCDNVVEITVKITCYETTITLYQRATVKSIDIDDVPYVSGSKTVTSGTIDLTEEGSKDWVQMNTSSISNYSRKNISSSFITNISAIQSTAGNASDAVFRFTATDAAGSAPASRTGIMLM